MELFLSEDDEKRESCMKHLKFWMNSICLHTFDEKSEKTAPVAIVGTRKDIICNAEDHEKISHILKDTFYLSVLWESLLIEQSNDLCFFPVNNKQTSSLDITVSQLLKVSQSFLEKVSYVTKQVSLVWLKILDEIKAKLESFLMLSEIIKICSKFSLPPEKVEEMLTYFCEMGILIWINEEKLRDIIILDPVEYFVKPVTLIICKHIATKDDPSHTVHCVEIHKVCREKWPQDWFQMLEFGIVSERLARNLLRSSCKDEIHVDNVLSLMERYGLSSSFLARHSGDSAICKSLFLPAVAPSSPVDYFVEEKLFENYATYKKYRNLVGRLHAKLVSCCEKFSEYVVFHFAFSVSTELLQHTLLSTEVLTSQGFLPNGLFERFIGRVCGTIASTHTDISTFLLRNIFIAFKDVVKLKFMFRSVRITNIAEGNMIRVEVEKDPGEEKDKEVMFIHDALFEMVQSIIRESYKSLVVMTLLPTDKQNYCDHPLLPLTELRSLCEGKMRSINYQTDDGIQSFSSEVETLRDSFSVYLGIGTIHPKKGDYSNKVHHVYVYSVPSCRRFLFVSIGTRKRIYCFPFS
jgi:hypothetical protein